MYEVYLVEDDGTKTLVNSTDVNVASIGTVYDILESKADGTLQKYVDDSSIQSVDKASMIATVINNITNQSVNSVFTKAKNDADIANTSSVITARDEQSAQDKKIKQTQIDFNNEKLNLEKRKKPFVLDQMRIDTNIKEQKYFTEQLRNGGVSFTYVFYRSYFDKFGVKVETDITDLDEIIIGEDTFILFRDYKRVESKTIVAGSGLSAVELQNFKTIEETDYITNQSNQLSASVIYNNKIQAGQILADVFGTGMAGSLVVPDTGWGALFSIANELSGSSLVSTGFAGGVISI